MNYASALIKHYEQHWGQVRRRLFMEHGPIHELPAGYQIIEFYHESRHEWIYATVNAASGDSRFEYHLIAPKSNEHHVQTLTVLSHFSHTGPGLGVGHSVNLGEGWLPESSCDHLLLSLPYLDGQGLEQFEFAGELAWCLWVLPITEPERDYKMEHGLDALESLFEAHEIAYADPLRVSLV